MLLATPLLMLLHEPTDVSTKMLFTHVFFFLPIIVSVVCPTGAYPPLRLARRPNQGHVGGGGWTPFRGTCL